MGLKGLESEFQQALVTLGMGEHYPVIKLARLVLSRPRDILVQRNLRENLPSSSPLFPYRHAWGLLVKSAVKKLANEVLRDWATTQPSRGEEWLRERPRPTGSPPLWDLSEQAPWMSWNLQPSHEYLLLSLRTHGTTLQRHAHPSRWGLFNYDDLFCPLCSEAHKTEQLEDSLHMLSECKPLEHAWSLVNAAAQEYLEQHPIHFGTTPVEGASGGPRVGWMKLSPRKRQQLLLGYPPAGHGAYAMTPAESPVLSRNAWAEGLVRATIPHVRALLRARDAQEAAIDESYRKTHTEEGEDYDDTEASEEERAEG